MTALLFITQENCVYVISDYLVVFGGCQFLFSLFLSFDTQRKVWAAPSVLWALFCCTGAVWSPLSTCHPVLAGGNDVTTHLCVSGMREATHVYITCACLNEVFR